MPVCDWSMILSIVFMENGKEYYILVGKCSELGDLMQSGDAVSSMRDFSCEVSNLYKLDIVVVFLMQSILGPSLGLVRNHNNTTLTITQH